MRHREEPMHQRLTVLLVAVAALAFLFALAKVAPTATYIVATLALCGLIVFFWFAGRDN